MYRTVTWLRNRAVVLLIAYWRGKRVSAVGEPESVQSTWGFIFVTLRVILPARNPQLLKCLVDFLRPYMAILRQWFTFDHDCPLQFIRSYNRTTFNTAMGQHMIPYAKEIYCNEFMLSKRAPKQSFFFFLLLGPRWLMPRMYCSHIGLFYYP